MLVSFLLLLPGQLILSEFFPDGWDPGALPSFPRHKPAVRQSSLYHWKREENSKVLACSHKHSVPFLYDTSWRPRVRASADEHQFPAPLGSPDGRQRSEEHTSESSH